MANVMIISADCHAGALPETYREYLPARLHDGTGENLHGGGLEAAYLHAVLRDRFVGGTGDNGRRLAPLPSFG